MQLALMLSQDAGHLHILTVVARINNLGYNPNLQALLDNLLIGIHTVLRRVLEVLESDVHVFMEAQNRWLQQILETEEFMDTASDWDTHWMLVQTELEEEDDSILIEDPRPLDTSVDVDEEEGDEEETQLEAAQRLEAAGLESRTKRIINISREETQKIRGQVEFEAEIYRTAVEKMVKLAETKGKFLKMAAFSTEEAADGTIQKLKEHTTFPYKEEEGKVEELRKNMRELKVKREKEKRKENNTRNMNDGDKGRPQKEDKKERDKTEMEDAPEKKRVKEGKPEKEEVKQNERKPEKGKNKEEHDNKKEEDKDVTLPVLKPVMVVWPQQMARRVFTREDLEVGPDVVVESEIFL